MNIKWTSWITLAALQTGMAGNALAATVFTDRTAFEAALLSSTIEDFETTTPYGDPNASPWAPDGLNYLALTYFSLEATPQAIKILDSDPLSGSRNTTTGGQNFLYLDTDNPGTDLTGSTTTISLYNSVDAFGFNFTGVAEPGTTFKVSIGSVVFDLGLNNPENTPLFWGISGLGSFTDIILSTSLDSGYGVDDITFGSTIPLPPALWLFGTGLLALAGSARKRKANS